MRGTILESLAERKAYPMALAIESRSVDASILFYDFVDSHVLTSCLVAHNHCPCTGLVHSKRFQECIPAFPQKVVKRRIRHLCPGFSFFSFSLNVEKRLGGGISSSKWVWDSPDQRSESSLNSV